MNKKEIIRKEGKCKNCGIIAILDKGVCEKCWYELGYHKGGKKK